MSTRIIAHRGYSERYPENTLTAFKAALDLGSDGIELDVHFTKDGNVIVHHDYALGKPDNGEGLIYEQDLPYIQGLTIDSSEKIPTLQEVFELVGNKMNYEIELKGCGKEFLKAVIELARRFDLLANIEFTSPHAYNLTYLRMIEPAIKTGSFIPQFPDWMDERLGRILMIENADLGDINVLHCFPEMIDRQLINLAHARDIEIHAGDCNTEKTLLRAFEIGVDQLTTNRLELAQKIRADFVYI